MLAKGKTMVSQQAPVGSPFGYRSTAREVVEGIDLSGKHVVVTGGYSGIGTETVRALAGAGARVIVGARRTETAERVLGEMDGCIEVLPLDLADPQSVDDFADEVASRWDSLDILVNNAAVNVRATLDTFTAEQFDDMMHVNVRAPLLLAQAFLPSLVERTGAIVNIGSVNAHVGWQNLLVYAASKAALVGASRNMANALKYARVRVHCINPGWVDTEGERGAMRKLGHPDDFLDREGTALPMGRLIAPEEIAEAVLFFVSEKSAAFSGTVIDLEQYPLGCLHHPKHSEPMQ
jgi:NAD(P)-dependent dehydrogenase (short-subunit alcohol dehydrogenase family)